MVQCSFSWINKCIVPKSMADSCFQCIMYVVTSISAMYVTVLDYRRPTVTFLNFMPLANQEHIL
jgi:hypothetical protein